MDAVVTVTTRRIVPGEQIKIYYRSHLHVQAVNAGFVTRFIKIKAGFKVSFSKFEGISTKIRTKEGKVNEGRDQQRSRWMMEGSRDVQRQTGRCLNISSA